MSTYIAFNGMVQKLSVSPYQNLNQIENQLNIRKVMSKNVCMYVFSFVLIVSI